MRNRKNAEIIFANLFEFVHKLRFHIFHVTAAVFRNLFRNSIFGLFANFNLNRLLIFDDGLRNGSVTRNMD